ncbi:hypothetical protein [uncultured Kordia sp.]|uniref:hypothetical protein n=1 Tax=uncultured Kordia sp. TaxID=507699 RepID=UPI00261F4F42|nr:hypothetical protein [uncultured Kordia sp.]
MKKKNLRGLRLQKKNISNLNQESVTGGFTRGGCTTGCSDGCTPFQSNWNCTEGNCTGDCGNGLSLNINLCNSLVTNCDKQ